MEFDEDYQAERGTYLEGGVNSNSNTSFSVLDTNMIGFAEIPKGAQGKMHEYLFPLLELAEGTSNIQ
ncbi:hypothetical protein BM221_004635 [Beauveria bassiana]|uniref:Uncharacterized protein n=1 Tax=Beauveria bassiana TaxID=176275 RepID=A0A2N6NRS8_BEABA|nr:hypothetical protein BM221_004635 [Beauveria bassiana]